MPNFFENLDFLDDQLKGQAPPNRKSLDRIKELIASEEKFREYFFNHLENPEWLRILNFSGYFKSLPKKIHSGEYIQYPRWSEANYLSKIAAKEPELVYNILSSLPYSDNEVAHIDIIKVGLNLPDKFSAKVCHLEKNWVQNKQFFSFLYPEKASDLALKLINSDYSKQSLSLVSALLDLSIQESQKGNLFFDKISAKVSTYEYSRIIKKICKKTGYDNFEELLDIFSSKLDYAIENGPGSETHNYSWLWRPSIADSEENYRDESDIKSVLLVSIRDYALDCIKSLKDLQAVIKFLDSKKSQIYQRLELFILSSNPTMVSPQLAKEKILNRATFNERAYFNEYSELCRTCFKKLLPSDQSKFFEWVNNPPEEIIVQDINEWQHMMLEPVREHFPEKIMPALAERISSYSDNDYKKRLSRNKGFASPDSILTLTEIQERDINDVLEEIDNWKPSANVDYFPFDRNSILHQTANLIANDAGKSPEKYIKAISTHSKLPSMPILQGICRGLKDSIANDNNLEWSVLIKWFLDTYTSQLDPNDIEAEETTKSILWLLREGLKKRDNVEIPVTNRENVWKLIEWAAESHNLNVQNELKQEGIYHDPTHLSLNNVLGISCHASIDYGLWLYRNIELRSLNKAPELKKFFKTQLKRSTKLITVSSVYGQYYPWLCLLDKPWATAMKDQIFKKDDSYSYMSSWGSYLLMCNPYNDMLEILQSHYHKAVLRLGQQSDKKVIDDMDFNQNRIEKRLIEHIFSFYLRGLIELDDCLITGFMDHANVNHKGYVIDFIGRSLSNFPKNNVNKSLIDRLKKYYELRLDEAFSNRKTNELEGFSWWFESDVINPKWLLINLERTLELGTELKSTQTLLPQLSKMLKKYPSQVLRVLLLMVGQLSHSKHPSWDTDMKEVYESLTKMELSASDKDLANELVNQIGLMGGIDFRKYYVKLKES